MVWLTSQSVALLVVGCVAVAAVVAIVSRLLLRSLIPPESREAGYAIAAPLMPALGAAFAIFIGLSLANEAGYFGSAQAVVSNEAADAARLAWAATTPGVDTPAIHGALVDYLHATRTYEWHGSGAAQGDDPSTAAALAALERVVRSQSIRPGLGTPTSTELLASVDALTSERRARLAAASRVLPLLYVITLIVAGAALLANAGALTLRSGHGGLFLLGGLATVVGLSLALLFALGAPWGGTVVVSGHPLDAVIVDLRNGYFHA
jgi:hypothetical protein